MKAIKNPKKNELTITTQAEFNKSFRVVHETFLSSAATSLKNLGTASNAFVIHYSHISYINRPGRIRTYITRFWRPMLYQLELQAYFLFTPRLDSKTVCQCPPDCLLFRLAMRCMRSAKTTIFLQLNTLRLFLFILRTAVINAFAFCTLKLYIFAHNFIYSLAFFQSPRPDLNR